MIREDGKAAAAEGTIGEKDRMTKEPLAHLHMIINAKISHGYGKLTKQRAQGLVNEILRESGMKPLGAIHWADAEDLDFPGQSFVQMITTSHCSLHYFSDKDEIYFDLYSCKSFDPEAIIAILKKKMRMTRWRGLIYDRVSGMHSSLLEISSKGRGRHKKD